MSCPVHTKDHPSSGPVEKKNTVDKKKHSSTLLRNVFVRRINNGKLMNSEK